MTAERKLAAVPAKFNPREHLRQIKGKGGSADYLEVKWRLVWLREEHPDAAIVTELRDGGIEHNYAVFSASVAIPGGGSATGWGSETAKDFGDFLEKAETKAVGRALAALGYGTQFAPELDEGDSVADSPTRRGSDRRQSGDGSDQGRPGRAPARLPAATPAARVAQAGEPAAAEAAAGEGAEDFTWTEFWPWARARNLKSRQDLDAALGRDTGSMTPQQIYAALRAKDSAGKERRDWTVDDAVAWLKAGERPLAKQEQCCAWIFGQADDEAALAALAERVTPHVHQDARDVAWRDRMLALGLIEERDPAEEVPPAEEPAAAPEVTPTIEELRDAIWNGDPDDVPF